MVIKKDYKELGREIRKHYWDTVNKTIELFPFDDAETKQVMLDLPRAFGEDMADHGKPAEFPVQVYQEKLPKKVQEIIYMEPTKLIAKMQKGELKVYDVIRYYFHAGLFALMLTNCIYEFLPERALDQVKKLEKLQADGADMAKYPLFGLPLGVKEMIPLKGYAPTHGSPCHLDRITNYDAQIVEISERLGAVTICRETNVQSLMALECELWGHGLTVNPFNSKLAPGGSLGGSGATAGMRALAVSLGSDIGGLIRSPAACNGVYGLRLTLGRIPTLDYFSCQRGSQLIISVTGPITRSLKMAELFMKLIVAAEPWLMDPSLAPIPWKLPEQKKFRVGFVEWDGNVMPHPPILRGIREVKEKLSKLPNVEVVEFKQFGVDRSNEILGHLYFEDGGADTRAKCEATGEPILEQVHWAIDDAKELTWPEQWDWNIKKDEFRKDYLKHWMLYTNDNGEKLDAVIGPVYPAVAPKHKTAKYWLYTSLYNTLDLPTLVVPVGTVDPAKDKPNTDYKPANDMDKFYQSIYELADEYKNAPIAVGVTGMRFTDEKLFDIARLFANEDE